MTEFRLPWLELSVLLPLIGAVRCAFVRNPERARRISTVVCLLTLIGTLGEWVDFSSLAAQDAGHRRHVASILFGHRIFTVDALSAPLLPLAGLLYLLTTATTGRTKVSRFSFAWTLFSEAVLMATLSCRTPWMLALLMSVATVPPWVELRKRGRPVRAYLLHMTLFIGLLTAGVWMTSSQGRPGTLSVTGAGLIAAAALLRNGIVPLHGWMTDLFENATFGTALLFVTPMTGAYTVIRLVLPVAPEWLLQSIAILSLITAVCAAGLALVQTDSRRFFCYLFLSHSSLVLAGLESGTSVGLTGALCVWLSVGLSLPGFGLTLRSVEARTGRLSLRNHHGLIAHTPVLAALFLLTGLSSIGFPGTVGFVGTELLTEGAVGVHPFVGLAVVVATMLNGIAILHAYFRVFTGTQHEADITMRCHISERLSGLALFLLIIIGGLFPQPGVSSRHRAAVELVRQRSAAAAPHPVTPLPKPPGDASETNTETAWIAPDPRP